MNEWMKAQSGPPEDVVLVNDISGSMSECDWKPSRLAGAQEAGEMFLKHRAPYPDDRVAVIGFSQRAEIVQGLTEVSQPHLITHALGRLSARGNTSIGSGLASAEEALKQARPQAVRRIILYTDGRNNEPPDPRPVAEKLKQAGVVIFAVGIGGCPGDVDEALLKKIASEIQGKPAYRFIADKDEMVQLYKDLAETRLVHLGARQQAPATSNAVSTSTTTPGGVLRTIGKVLFG